MAIILTEPQMQFERPRMCRAAGTLATVTGLTAIEHEGGATDRSTLFLFKNVAITVTDNGATGSKGTKLYDFPKGLLDIAGALCNITYGYTTATDGAMVSGVGTAAAGADGALTTTEQDIIPSTATAIATSAGTFVGKSSATARLALFDGTSAAKALYYNVATTNDPGAGAILTVNGWLVVHWQNLGDNTIA